jgi:hypothetical protein
MDDRFDLGRRRDGDVGLGFDEQKERNDKQRRGPQGRTVLQTRIDCAQDRRGADAPESGHEQQLRQRAVHFTADELEEGHNVFRLHVHKMPPPAHQDTPPAETKNHFC